MLKQRLSQKLLQKLSPQQIQLMKLLQVPTASLEQRIKEELEANPALEEGSESLEKEDEFAESDDLEASEEYEEKEIDDEVDLSDYLSDTDDDIADYKLSGSNYSDDEEKQGAPIKVDKSFHEHLAQQLGLLDLEDRQYIIANQLIGSIDDDGYLRRDLEAVIDDLAFSQNIETTTDELEEILKFIQAFEPPGVGARDLRECLLLQLHVKPEEDPSVKTAVKILQDHFDEFAKKHYQKLEKQLSLTDDQLKEALEEILKLNPKPGSAYSDNAAKTVQYVTPDFILINNDGELQLSLNSRNAPDLRISSSYKEMFKSYDATKKKDKKQKEAVLFIKQKIDAAKWFIDAIKQRQATLLSTMHAIMDYQQDYFLTGDEIKLKPMILKDIAAITGLDISTVSRVANSKYVQTEFGTFQLKSFFSESMQTESGEEVSTREVKTILSDLVNNEDKRKPLSDQKLMELLKEKGYNIARRTVAKYREQLNLPVARLRKEL